jgi:peptidoglycan/LPS O-acetylase OafA/YrhL
VPTKPHLNYLDAVRGLAALSVYNEHFIIAYGLPCEELTCQTVLDNSLLHFWWDGGAAVSMFFVLSGLVLSLKYFQDKTGPNLYQFSLISYLVARTFRIWLPYCGVLALSGVLYSLSISQPPFVSQLAPSAWINGLWHQHPLDGWAMLRESYLIKLPTPNVLIPQAWTLSIELVLSLLLPLALLLAKHSIPWLVFFTGLAVAYLGLPIFTLHFLLGLVLARHQSQITIYFSQQVWLRRLCLVLGFILYGMGNVYPKLFTENELWSCSGIGSGLLLMYVMSSSQSQQLLSWLPIRLLGRLSYSSYLLHIAILICVTPFILHTLSELTSNYQTLWFSAWLLTFCVVVLASLLSFYYLEQPSISVGKWLINRTKKLRHLE